MKDMLTDKDLRRIGEELGKVLEDNIMPQFETVHKRLDKLETRLDKVEVRLDTEMVTKSYLDDKLADLRGDLLANDRRLEEKFLARK